jgi:beta-xylosidase
LIECCRSRHRHYGKDHIDKIKNAYENASTTTKADGKSLKMQRSEVTIEY